MAEVENVLQKIQETMTETARRVSSAEYARIYGLDGGPRTTPEIRERERLAREAQRAYEDALCRIIEARQLPDAALLAAETGSSLAECEQWLDEYIGKTRIANEEAAERRRIEEGIAAQQKVIAARAALEQGEAELVRVRGAQGLPMPDWNDPCLNTAGDPLLSSIVRLRAEHNAVKSQYGYLAELSRDPIAAQALAYNRDARRGRLADAVHAVRDSMRNHQRTIEQTQKLESDLLRLQQQIVDSRQREHTTHENITKAHVAFWRLSGKLLQDYEIPPKPQHGADAC